MIVKTVIKHLFNKERKADKKRQNKKDNALPSCLSPPEQRKTKSKS